MKGSAIAAIVIVAVAAILLACAASESDASSGRCGDNLTYDLSGSVLTVSGTGVMYDFSESPWFGERSSIESVVVADGVASIGAKAFYGCSSLKTADLGSVETIGMKAFANCASLSEVSMPSASEIGAYAFYGCKGLSCIGFSDSLASVGASAFQGMSFRGADGSAIPVSPDGLRGLLFLGSGGDLRESSLRAGMTIQDSGLTYRIISLSPLQASLVGFTGSPASLAVPGSIAYGGAEISVVSVGAKAFYGCTSLRSVDLGSVKSVGLKAFSYCSSLTSITIPETVKSVGGYAFFCCGLTSLTIPGDDVVLEASAFSACKKMSDIRFTGHGAVIGRNAFYNNNGVSSVDLSTVASVGFKAFPYCYGLRSVTIPSNISAVGEYAFFNCANLKEVVIEDGVRKIGRSAFSGCKSLESITLPESLVYIGPNAFYGLKFLDEGGKTMEHGLKLRGHTFTGSGKVLSVSSGIRDGDEFASGGLVYRVASASLGEASLVGYVSSPVRLEVPAYVEYMGARLSVTSVGENSFYACTSLESVSLGSVTSVGDKAFMNCPNLGSIDLSCVESVGFKAFANAASVKELTVPDTVKEIGGYAFFGLSSLSSLTIASATESIGGGAFSGCASLDSIGGTHPGIADGTMLVAGSSLVSCAAGPGVVEAEVPYGVETIADGAFSGCSHIEKIILPNSVKAMGLYAIYGCKSLSHLSVSKSLASVNKNSIHGTVLYEADGTALPCTAEALAGKSFKMKDGKLTGVINGGEEFVDGDFRYRVKSVESCEVSISASSLELSHENLVIPAKVGYRGLTFDVTSVIYEGFSGLNIKTLTVPGSIRSFDDWAFAYCASLESVVIESPAANIADYMFSGCTSLKSVALSESSTCIPYNAFSGCTSLESITLPDSVKTIVKDAFGGCTSLKSIIGGSLTTIGDKAFYKCTSLASIDLKNVRHIGFKAFAYCTSLASLEFAENLSSVGEYAFFGLSFYDGKTKLGATAEDLAGKAFEGSSGVLTEKSPEVPETYEITITVREEGYGFVSVSRVSAEAGASISAEGNALTIGSSTVKAYPSISTPQYEYIFAGWDVPSYVVGGDMAVAAVFYRAVNQYEVTWLNEDGSVISTEYLEWGAMPSAWVPVKESDSQYSYEFRGWEPEVAKVTGNAAYAAVFDRSPRAYVITVIAQPAGSGTVSPSSIEAEYGAAISADGNVLTVGGSRSVAAASGSYVFSGWSIPSGVVGGNMTVYAMFEPSNEIGTQFLVGGIRYQVTSQTEASVIGYEGEILDLEISERIMHSGHDYSVKTVGEYAFKDCKSLETLDLSHIESIGMRAFHGCDGIMRVVFGNDLREVGSYAFRDVIFEDQFGTRLNPTAANLVGHAFEYSYSTGHLSCIDPLPKFTVRIIAEPAEYGYVTPTSIQVEYGSDVVISNDTLKIGTVSIRAVPNTGIDGTCFSGWSDLPSTITEDTEVKAIFDRFVTIRFEESLFSKSFEIETKYGTNFEERIRNVLMEHKIESGDREVRFYKIEGCYENYDDKKHEYKDKWDWVATESKTYYPRWVSTAFPDYNPTMEYYGDENDETDLGIYLGYRAKDDSTFYMYSLGKMKDVILCDGYGKAFYVTDGQTSVSNIELSGATITTGTLKGSIQGGIDGNIDGGINGFVTDPASDAGVASAAGVFIEGLGGVVSAIPGAQAAGTILGGLGKMTSGIADAIDASSDTEHPVDLTASLTAKLNANLKFLSDINTVSETKMGGIIDTTQFVNTTPYQYLKFVMLADVEVIQVLEIKNGKCVGTHYEYNILGIKDQVGNYADNIDGQWVSSPTNSFDRVILRAPIATDSVNVGRINDDRLALAQLYGVTGSGTTNDPYIICKPSELSLIPRDPAGVFKLG